MYRNFYKNVGICLVHTDLNCLFKNRILFCSTRQFFNYFVHELIYIYVYIQTIDKVKIYSLSLGVTILSKSFGHICSINAF